MNAIPEKQPDACKVDGCDSAARRNSSMCKKHYDMAWRRSDRGQVLSRFSSALAMLVEMDAYWCPSRNCAVFRGVGVTRRFQMPQDVVLVGRYAQSPQFKPKDFMGDLDALLAKLARNALLAPR